MKFNVGILQEVFICHSMYTHTILSGHTVRAVNPARHTYVPLHEGIEREEDTQREPVGPER